MFNKIKLLNSITTIFSKKDPQEEANEIPMEDVLLPQEETQHESSPPTAEIKLDQLGTDLSIEAHNAQILESINNKLLLCEAPTEKSNTFGPSNIAIKAVSMQEQKRIILNDFYSKCVQMKEKDGMINLTTMAKELETQYKGTPCENLLNLMVHNEGPHNLKDIIESNLQFINNQLFQSKMNNVSVVDLSGI
jgi:hypothetical protein